jgi:hypothetical protein
MGSFLISGEFFPDAVDLPWGFSLEAENATATGKPGFRLLRCNNFWVRFRLGGQSAFFSPQRISRG